ncbi:tyrosine-type recombinase/integrase [Nesterenkonia ebinurensis]|uniref:tyrosine-type recombinase/integrase n=1 Tax=Nesterenkonia ebinurensis TaxID=2608252 RepID=UPI00123CE669|nr:tyrosine-type recombinase/integrase [Nesterenkonia ebinurensis]
MDSIDEDDVARWVSWIATEGKAKRSRNNGEVISRSGYSPKSIKNSHSFLYSIFQWAVRRGHRMDNPAAETRLPKKSVTDDRNKFLTAEEVTTLMPHVEARYRPYVTFLFNTGLRAGELLVLTPEDFTVADGVTYVSVSKNVKTGGDGKSAITGLPKSERSRRRIDVDEGTMSEVWPLIRAAGHGNKIFTYPKPGHSAALNKSM